jgi:poly(beta-D-mannuronate) lyase
MKRIRCSIIASLIVAATLSSFSVGLHAAEQGSALVPPFDVAPVRAKVGEKDKHSFSCDQPPPAIRDLQFFTMYDKSDKSFSTLDPAAYAAYKKAYEPIAFFEKHLVWMANRYVRSNPPRADIAACDLDWLDAWAKDAALLGQVNENGEYIRKWLLASIANSWIQIRDDPFSGPDKDPASRRLDTQGRASVPS